MRPAPLLCALLVAACSAAPGDPVVLPDASPVPDGARLDAPRADVGAPPDAPPDVTAPPEDARLTCPDRSLPCDGVCCGAGTTCAGGYCCAEAARCGGVCCGPARRCEGGTCVFDCRDRARCGSGATATCCLSGQVCYLGACATPGAACNDLTRCPEAQYCEPTLLRCLPRPTSAEACEYRPPAARFTPQLKWAWARDATVFPTHDQVMMQPAVANLTDDNRDGVIDRNDIPDVVFSTFTGNNYVTDGVLRAVSGADGRRLWPVEDPGYRTVPGSSVAIADVDPSSPGPEVITCAQGDRMVAGHAVILRADGRLLRRVQSVPCGYSAPAVGDMDNDGVPEIAVRNKVFHADGTVLAGFVGQTAVTTLGSPMDFNALADLDGDGTLELVSGNKAWRVNGTALWDRADLPGGSPAVADLNRDGVPDVAVVQPSAHSLIALNGRTGVTLWGAIEINRITPTMGPSGGGPPTVADFDGDGAPEVATAGGDNYLVLRGATGERLWHTISQDTSSRVTGSSVFDFEGDGRAEVVYNDELLLRVYRGTDGEVLWSTCNTSGTLWEYPVIVDVDRDDSADIVVMANNYGAARYMCSDGTPPTTGIRVYSDPAGNWVRTRPIWNQHTYHVTNVDDDGRVPRRETPHWTVRGLNNFRQNVQPDGLFDAPDLTPIDLDADVSACPARLRLRVRVVNRGRAGAPAGVPVLFFTGTPGGTRTLLGRAVTTRRLLPGDSEAVSVELPPERAAETLPVFVVVNDPATMPLGALHECRVDNNTLGPQRVACASPG